MTARRSKRAGPWSTKQAERRTASTSTAWADAIDEKILAACHTAQRWLVVDPADRISALVARGGGKTAAIAARLIRKAVRRKRAVMLYFGPTRERAKELIWERLRSMCEQLGIKARFYEGSLKIVFDKTKSRIMLAGAEEQADIEKYRGQSFDEVAVDETSLVRDSILRSMVFEVIGPRLGDRDGCIALYGTPGKRRGGLWYEVTFPGSGSDLRHRPYRDREDPEFADWIGWSSHAWTMEEAAKDVPSIAKLWADALRTKQREQWGDQHPVWLREYKGVWAEDNTEAIYSAYRADVNGWAPEMVVRGSVRIAKLPDDVLALGSILHAYGGDLGHSDPFALNVFAWSSRDRQRRIYHVFCFEKRRLYTQKIAQLLLGEDNEREMKVRPPDKPLGVIGATGWPAVSAFDMAGTGNAILAELQFVYGVKMNAAKKADKYGCFEVVNGAFTDGRLFVLRGSLLEEQVLALQWTTNDAGQLVEPKGVPNHSSDAMVYAVPPAAAMFEFEEGSPDAGAASSTPDEAPPDTVPVVLDVPIDDRFPFEDLTEHAGIGAYGRHR